MLNSRINSNKELSRFSLNAFATGRFYTFCDSFNRLKREALVMAKVSPAQFVRQVRQEVSRISWATRRDTGLATITVFVMATIAAIFFLLVDMVLSNVVQFVLGFGG